MDFQRSFAALDIKQHDVKSFNCGKPAMNDFLSKHASKHTQLGLSKTYVLCSASQVEKSKVAAYFTLASAEVSREEIPSVSLPRYPIPVVLLARLAVDQDFQGLGLGAKSLVYALRQAYGLVSNGLPAHGLILDVFDKDALGFYQAFDTFEPFTLDPMRLFVSMKTIAEL